MAPPERRLSAEAKPFAPPAGPTLAKVVSRDDDEQTSSPRRRGVIVDNMKVSYGFVRLDDDAAAQDLFLHLTDCAYAQRAPRPAAPVITMRRRIPGARHRAPGPLSLPRRGACY